MVSQGRYNRSILFLILWFTLILVSIKGQKIHYYPDTGKRYLSIRLMLEGAWQEQIEKLLIDPFEKEIRMLEEIREIRSFSGEEKGRIILQLTDDADIEETRSRVQEIAERIPLPPRAKRPVIETGDQDKTPVFVVMLENEDEISLEELKSTFSALRGCGRIDTGSSKQKDLVINIPEERLISLDMTPSDAAQTIRESSQAVLLPMQGDYALSIDPRFSTPGEGDSLIIRTGLKIRDLGYLSLLPAESEYISRMNGRTVAMLWVRESGDLDTVSLCRSLRVISNRIPGCYIVYDRGELIEKALGEILLILGISTAAVALITAFLIRSPLPVLLLTLNLPFSLGGCLALHRFLNWDVDILTLAGLALSAGMIIDGGIIYLESGFLRARSPLLSSLISTLLVLLVFIYAPRSLLIPCLSLIRACSLSLIFSVFFIMTVMHGLLDLKEPSAIQNRFRNISVSRGVSLLILIPLTLISLPAAASMSVREGINPSENIIYLTLEYPAGIPGDFLAEQLKEFEKSLQKECRMVIASYGDEKANFQLHPRDGISAEQIKTIIGSRLKDEKASIHYPGDESEDSGYTVRLFASDRKLLYSESERLSSAISSLLAESRIVLHYKKRLPLIRFQIPIASSDGPAARELYTKMNQLMSAPVQAKWFPPEGYGNQWIYDVRVKNPEWNNYISSLQNLKINGYPPLSVLSEASYQEDYGTIEHFSGRRSLSFTIFNKPHSGTGIEKQLKELLDHMDLPSGLWISHGEEHHEMIRFKRQALGLLILSLILLFLLLTAVFEKAAMPLYLLIQIVLTELFTIAILDKLGIELSAPVIFALILNAGLSVNNGLLVFSPFRTRGLPSLEEALDSLALCSASILSAALTTLAGLIPLLFQSTGFTALLPSLSLAIGLGVLISPIVLVLSLPLFFKKTADTKGNRMTINNLRL